MKIHKSTVENMEKEMERDKERKIKQTQNVKQKCNKKKMRDKPIISKSVTLPHTDNSYNKPCCPLHSTFTSFHSFSEPAQSFVLELWEWGAARSRMRALRALHNSGIDKGSQGRPASSCYWNSYVV